MRLSGLRRAWYQGAVFRKLLCLLLTIGVVAPIVWLSIEHVRGRRALAATLKEFADRKEVLDLSSLWPTPVPATSNGLNEELAAVGRMSDLVRLNVPVMMLGGPGKALAGTRVDGWAKGPDRHTWEEVGALVERHAANFDALQSALERPYRRMSLDLSAGFSKLRVAHLGPVKSVVMCLGFSALAAARRGDFDGALADLELARVVELDLEAEPLFISQLVRLACISITQRNAWAVLHTANWTPEQMRRLQALVESGSDSFAPMFRSLQGERAGLLPELQGRGGTDVAEVFSLMGGLFGGGGSSNLEMPGSVDEAIEMAQPVLARVANFVMTRVLFPIWYYGWGDQAINEYLRSMEVLVKSGQEATSSVDFRKRLDESLMPRIRPGPGYRRLRSVFASSLVPAFETTVAKVFRAETERTLFTTEIALRRYLASHGQLPETLEALVPEFLKALPVDPMDGKPIRYRREETGGFTLWSVGEDGIDDGGHAALPENAWHGRAYSPWVRGKDAVWPQPVSDEERAQWVAADVRQWEKARQPTTNQVPPISAEILNTPELLKRYGLAPRSAKAAAAKEAPGRQEGTLRLRVVDSITGQPMACTVKLTDSQGVVSLDGEGLREGFRCVGTVERTVPAGPAHLRITRGLEYLAEERAIEIAAGGVASIEVAMRRQVDLRARGWYAQDHHAHMLHGERTLPVSFEQVALAARAEDLQGLSVAQAWAMENPTAERLQAELDAHSTAECRLAWNLEAPKNYYLGDAGRCLGHCWNVGMRGRTPWGEDVIAILLQASAWDYESEKPSFANFESQALIRSQGGAVFYTHPARWWTGAWGGAGGYAKQASMRISNMAVELPFDVLAGPTFDGLDVITGTGEVDADEKAFRLWGLLLNHGYRVAATASSDACFDRPGGATPGAARLYTYLDEPFSFAAAARAAAKGRTLATTGPLLVASVESEPPGTAFPADGRSYSLRLEAWPSGATTARLDRVEIFRNGEVYRTFRPNADSWPWTTNLTLAPTSSEWYCARAFDADARRQRAVTGAFFFDATRWRSPEPVPATVRAKVLAEDTGKEIDATLTEVSYLGTHPEPGPRHLAAGGELLVKIPGTSRLRAEATGFQPQTLSPFFDHAELIREVTMLDAEALLDWRTYERIRARMGEVSLTFRLRRAVAR
ncbi:MAG: CehA/McbA family metallohydrolase [Verrucomicrobiales bacterium]|nr:CehA/McbA family metallohydrolase [Verrucomicrobiales bacterium]